MDIYDNVDIIEKELVKMMLSSDDTLFENEPYIFIEISKNSHIKYEYDKQKNALVCDRILHTPFRYEFNYGFIQNTLSNDGDPIDVVILMNDSLVPGSYIKCKFLGYLETRDDEGNDPKLIMCPCKSVDPTYSSIQSIHDIDSLTLQKIKYFFEHYKDLENKKVVVGDFLDKENAIEEYRKSIVRYRLTYFS
jgi:inorganic pyrophosphatase